jgi:hypothetical protein
VQLKRLGRVKKPVRDGQLGYLFISFLDSSGRPSRKLVAVTVQDCRIRAMHDGSSKAKWKVMVHMKPLPKTCWNIPTANEVKKVQLRTSAVPLENVMAELAKFELDKKLIAAQMDLDGHRASWINPELSSEEPGFLQEIAAFRKGFDVWL